MTRQEWIDWATARVRGLKSQAKCSGTEALSQIANELAGDLLYRFSKDAAQIWEDFEKALGVEYVEVEGPIDLGYTVAPPTRQVDSEIKQ